VNKKARLTGVIKQRAQDAAHKILRGEREMNNAMRIEGEQELFGAVGFWRDMGSRDGRFVGLRQMLRLPTGCAQPWALRQKVAQVWAGEMEPTIDANHAERNLL
jgi:hypothetical protein